MSTTMLNIHLLRKIVDWALDESDKPKGQSQWDQTMWASVAPSAHVDLSDTIETDGWTAYVRHPVVEVSCGTTLCLAGNACVVSGDTLLVEESDWVAAVRSGDDIVQTAVVRTRAGQVTDIEERATSLLGLDAFEAHVLFHSGNTIEDVLRVARDIAVDHGFDLGR